MPVVSYKSDGELLIIGPSAAAIGWAERLREQFPVSVLITRTEGGELPIDRSYPVFSGAEAAISGYLGAFEVAWRQRNPIDLEVCTRCNACIHACPEQAIDFTYQIDLDKCKAHRQCVKVCGEIKAVDFERADVQRSEQFDLVLDLSEPPLIRTTQPPQGYRSPGKDPRQASRCRRSVGRRVREAEVLHTNRTFVHSRLRSWAARSARRVLDGAIVSEGRRTGSGRAAPVHGLWRLRRGLSS